MSKFNPLRYAQQLKEAGVPESQANIQAAALYDAMENNLASKEDLIHLEERLDNRIHTVETKLNWLMSLVSFVGIVLTIINFFHLR